MGFTLCAIQKRQPGTVGGGVVALPHSLLSSRAASLRSLRAVISQQQFNALAAQGYNRIPVAREVLSDLDTPLSVYLKLADGPYAYLFESVEGGENWGRHSIIGLPCRRVYSLRGHTLSIEELGEVVETRELADPLAEIAREAKVSKGTLYVYFDSKEALFSALVEQSRRASVERLMDFDYEHANVRDALVHFATGLIGKLSAPEHVALVRMVIGASEKFPGVARDYFEAGPAHGAARLAGYLREQERLQQQQHQPAQAVPGVVGPVGRQLAGGSADQKLLHGYGDLLTAVVQQNRRICVKAAALGHGGQHGLRCGGRGVNGVRQHRSRRFGHRGGGLCQRQGGKRRGKRQKAEHHRPAQCFPQGADPPCNLRRTVVQ